ncbi:quinone oxidoreductase family protein [Oceanobacillus jeddahense]|uniref:quinone oxidoreductase family protein n=1 Tax=Oceanobacillus jeddahense TaxID=1462527 RepID=UPI0005959EB5|nr:zinc-binding dehydrogenase [Oceanobacillus jeddahense]
MMKALLVNDYNGPETMQYTEIENPAPKDNEVVIQVQYSGVGLVDILFSRGFGQRKLPFIPGLEVSGTVKNVGKNVEKFKKGDRVAALTINGLKGFAELVSVGEDYVVKVPDELDLGIAAGTLTNTATALVLLKEITPIHVGGSLLVYGATGGLGSQVGQIAKLLGAQKVVGVVSTESKKVKAEQLGFDHVYLQEEFLNSSNELFDIVVDPIGGKQRKLNLDRLNPYGSLAIVGNASQEELADINPDTLWLKNLSITGFNFGMYTSQYTKRVNKYLEWAIQLIYQKQLDLPTVYKTPISEASESLIKLENGEINGKLLLEYH